jgi:hypothetical protein
MRITPPLCASPTLSSERRRRFAKGGSLRRSPSAWLSVCSAALVLLAAGCGGGGEPSDAATLDPAVAEQLAAQSEAVADALEADDGCEAAERADELNATLEEAADRGEVPEPIRQEIDRVLDRELPCTEPAPPTQPPPAPPPPSGDGDGDGDGDD